MSKNHKAGHPFRRKENTSERDRSMVYAVHGFWSGDNVRVSQSRDWKTDQWGLPQIGWSCGGREPAKEPDDLVAAECFAKAIFDAVQVARQWKERKHPDFVEVK